MGSHVVADPLCYRKISVCGFHVRKITFLVILRSLRNQEPIKTSDILQYGVRACCIILSFKFWFLVVHGVCHLDFGDGNPHVKYLCAVANFYDEYYSVIGSFRIF